jgi:hypothetical protein
VLVAVGAGTAVVLVLAAVAVMLHNGHSGPAPAAAATDSHDQPEGPGDPVHSPSATPSASDSVAPDASSSAARPAPTTTTTGTGSGPTAGLHQYADSYKVQQPYDLPLSARFSVDPGPVYNAWILAGAKPFSEGSTTAPRTEMRWGNWSGVEHMWEADVLIDAGTEGTALMQVKSNDGFEPVYVNVKNNGSLYNDSNHTPLATGMLGVWFHMVCAYDPVSGNGRVWINGRLAITRYDPHPTGTVWYFKNGVYGISASRSETHFRNVRFWSR